MIDIGTGPAGAGAERLDAAVYRVAAVATLGSLLAQLDATIVNVSLADLARDLHTNLSTIQWVTSGYLLALTFVLPLSGWLVGRVGGKAVYLWCFALFTLASALCGLAWSGGSLIGFRILQGLGGGLLAPMSQLMIRRAAGDQFTRIAGYASLPVLLGPLLGPVVAGLILAHASWRWLFLTNLPVGGLAFALAALLLPDDREEEVRRPLDWMGLLLLSPALALLLYGLQAIKDAAGAAAAAIGAVMFVGFLWVEHRRGDRALIDLALFRHRAFSVAAATQFLWNGALFAGQMLVPLFLIRVEGRSPEEVGWLLAPLGLGMMASVPTLGFWTKRFPERTVALFGAALSFAATLALVGLASTGWAADRLGVVLLASALFLRGVGQGAVGLPTVSAAYAAVDRAALPMATTALNVVQRLGGPVLTTLCAAVISGLLDRRVTLAGLDSWALAFGLLAIVHGLMIMSTFGLPVQARRTGAAIP